MLSNDYISEVQKELDKHYSTGLDEAGDHAVHILRTDDSDNALIVRHPTVFDGQDNDEVPAKLKRFLVIRLIANDGQWGYLVNQQMIHAHKFAGKSYSLCLNQFKNNTITEKGQKKLRQNLMNEFRIKLTYNGLLVAKVTGKFITAYDNLVKAIKYIEANGANYTQQSNINPTYEAEKGLRMEQDAIKDADKEFQASKNKSHSSTRHSVSKSNSKKKLSKRGKPRVKSHHNSAKAHLSVKTCNLAGKKVVALGKLNQTKAHYHKVLKAHGGSLQSHVNSKTQYVICNQPTKSKEYQKAVELHLPIINEKQVKFE